MSAFSSPAFVERWRTMSIVEQLGNIGSEVGRALSWKKKGHQELSGKALDRSLELIDLTLSDPRWKGARRREIARAREFLCDLFLGENVYGMTDEAFIRYFQAFAVAARRNLRAVAQKPHQSQIHSSALRSSRAQGIAKSEYGIANDEDK